MPARERDGVDRVRLAPQAGERGPGVREGVDADAEPRDAVAAGNADQAEEQDDRDLHRGEMLQHVEVEDHDHADEQLQQQDELALRDQVGLARFVDQFGDLVHRSMHRQVAQLHEDDHAEHQAEQRDEQADGQQRAAAVALEVDLTEVGQNQVRFTARVPRRCLLRGRLRRLRTERRDGGRPQQHRQQSGQTPRTRTQHMQHLSPRKPPTAQTGGSYHKRP